MLEAAIAVVYLVAGVLMIFDPAGAAIALTLIIGVALLTVGALRLAIAIQHRGQRGWKWAVAGGIATLLLGGLILLGWPMSGLWVIGLFIAVELLINGWTAIFVGLAARRAKHHRDRPAAGQDDAATDRAA